MRGEAPRVLWAPTAEQIEASRMDRFRRFVNDRHGLALANYAALYDWSVRQIPSFWAAAWDFFDVTRSSPYSEVVDDTRKMPGARWFSGARLNFAENLLRYRDDRIALRFWGENGARRQVSYAELYRETARMVEALRRAGVVPGDRVAAFIPNIPEAIVGMLAAASLGAIWSSCSPDFGVDGVLDRFRQIEPKVLLAADGYFFNGRRYDSMEKLGAIIGKLPSVATVVVVPCTGGAENLGRVRGAVEYEDFLAPGEAAEVDFAQLPFDHPLYILYSSGTTGLPKSIVHSAGGTLLQHFKELGLHVNLTREDTVFYFTTCGWMMWNWLASCLALGSTLVLYDGSPVYPDAGALWRMAAELGITVFGTSARFIAACQGEQRKVGESCDLSRLRQILSTGSPLVEENFDYVYRDVKPNVHLASISGGTDIVSCFVGGNPTLPVVRGEIQCRALAMKVEAWDENGRAVIGRKGELVCAAAFPSMPTHFWNDPDVSKYRRAYFDVYPNVWRHGDFIEINERGGVRIFGRSDATLNPGGVRIGTAEIYRVVETLPEILDSLAVGQPWKGDERVILFVRLRGGAALTEALRERVRLAIRTGCSPRHVPTKIVAVADVPYTINGKKVELAVRAILQGEDVANRDALANPQSLELYRDLPELAS